MPSPFPGMDPWLERPMVFPALHNSLLIYVQEALNSLLPRPYVATTANRVWVDAEQRREPDVGVFGPAAPPPGGAGSATLAPAGVLTVAAEPLSDPIEEPYLEILSDEGDRLVTAVEVLSLSNKKSGDSGRAAYRHKQTECRASGVNLVEIDLLRGGAHATAVSETNLRAAAGPIDYHVCTTAATVADRHFVIPIRLADRLPAVSIPLDPDVTPVTVDLQSVFDRCYDAGGFARLAKYDRQSPVPPLTDEQRQWAEGILRQKGLLP